MITAEIAVVPVGTGSTSYSDYIAKSEKVLDKYPDLSHKITAMSTEIEGKNLNEIFEALKEMHEAQITNGAARVQTTIRIDDRRDKECSMSEKVASVKSKI
ncbi:MAG: protein of unknown function DUF77 [uncultured bacterium]|nr:MAG: protein of unknown function DUF77 [uncultured bacterium]HBH17414.1 hypothetical protein [Cyanobacteria bacterium UBA9579]